VSWLPPSCFTFRFRLLSAVIGCGKIENRQMPNDELQVVVNAATSLDLGFLTRQTIGFTRQKT
jgi:hypothetical protein